MHNYKALKSAGKVSVQKVKEIDRAKVDDVAEVKYKDGDDIPEGKEIGDVKTEAREKTYVRTHYGLIAQEVEQVLENNNIDSIDFAPFIKSPVLDGDGINGEPTGEHRYGMRYAEYVGILIKAVQELSAKVEALENE